MNIVDREYELLGLVTKQETTSLRDSYIDTASNPQNSTCPVKARKPCWEILELDHPEHIECYYCQKLHSENDLLARSKPKCSKLNQKLRTADFTHADFDLSVFRLLMKQHCQGHVNENLLRMLSYWDKKPLIDGFKSSALSPSRKLWTATFSCM